MIHIYLTLYTDRTSFTDLTVVHILHLFSPSNLSLSQWEPEGRADCHRTRLLEVAAKIHVKMLKL